MLKRINLLSSPIGVVLYHNSELRYLSFLFFAVNIIVANLLHKDRKILQMRMGYILSLLGLFLASVAILLPVLQSSLSNYTLTTGYKFMYTSTLFGSLLFQPIGLMIYGFYVKKFKNKCSLDVRVIVYNF